MLSRTREAAFQLQIQIFAWMAENFAARTGPLNTTLLRSDPLDCSIFATTPNEQATAILQAYAERILMRQSIDFIPVQVALLARELPRLSEHKELHMPVHTGAPERYYTDKWGRPVAYFEPSRLTETSYIPSRLAQFMGQHLLMSGQKFEPLQHFNYLDLMSGAASFVGLALFNPKHKNSNAQCAIDGLTLYWMCQGQTAAQIRSTCLMRYPNVELEKLDKALAEASKFEKQISELRQYLASRKQNLRQCA